MSSGTSSFAFWRIHGAKALLTGKITREKDGYFKIEARLWDLAEGRNLSIHQYFTELSIGARSATSLRARSITRLTGMDGHFEVDNPN